MSKAAQAKHASLNLTAVELFCGIGGFRLAADRLGIRTVWANDLNAASTAVYRHRFGSAEIVEGDIAALVEAVPDHDLLTAGFPCQPFSAAGKKLGVKDPRGTLFKSIVDILDARRPEYFVLENVKRMLTMERGIHFATILATLARLPYFVEWRVLNAKHFALAQNRERLVLVGRRLNGEVAPPKLVRLLSSADALGLPARLVAALDKPQNWQPVEDHTVRFPTWGVALAGRFLAADVDTFCAASPPVTLGEVLCSSVPSEYDLTESTLARLDANDPVDRFVKEMLINDLCDAH